MQTTIYLIRHSKRMWEWSRDGVSKQDDSYMPLSTEGTLLAMKLAERKEFE